MGLVHCGICATGLYNDPVFYFLSGIRKTLIRNDFKQKLCTFQLHLMPFGVALPWYQIYVQVIYCWNEWIHLVCYSLCILYINTICNTERATTPTRVMKTPSNSMMTSSNGNLFRVTDHLCGEYTGHQWIPHTKASDAELWCFLWSASEYKRLSKQRWGWWFETPPRPLWRHCNGFAAIHTLPAICLESPY